MRADATIGGAGGGSRFENIRKIQRFQSRARLKVPRSTDATTTSTTISYDARSTKSGREEASIICSEDGDLPPATRGCRSIHSLVNKHEQTRIASAPTHSHPKACVESVETPYLLTGSSFGNHSRILYQQHCQFHHSGHAGTMYVDNRLVPAITVDFKGAKRREGPKNATVSWRNEDQGGFH